MPGDAMTTTVSKDTFPVAPAGSTARFPAYPGAVAIASEYRDPLKPAGGRFFILLRSFLVLPRRQRLHSPPPPTLSRRGGRPTRYWLAAVIRFPVNRSEASNHRPAGLSEASGECLAIVVPAWQQPMAGSARRPNRRLPGANQARRSPADSTGQTKNAT